MKKFGTREDVIKGLSKQTRGGLTKQFLKYNAEGKIISVRRRKQRGGVTDSNPYSNLEYKSANETERYNSLRSSQNTSRIHKVATTEECIIYYQNGKSRYYFNAFNANEIDISYNLYLQMLVKAINHSITQYDDTYKEFIVSINSEPTELNRKNKSIFYLTNIIYWEKEWYIKYLTFADIDKFQNINININSNLMFLINNETNSEYKNNLPNSNQIKKSIQDAVRLLNKV